MNLFQRWMQPGSPRKPAWPFTQTQRASPHQEKSALAEAGALGLLLQSETRTEV